MDAEMTSRGAGTGPAAGTVPRAAGPEVAVAAAETDSRSAQTARIWATTAQRPGANAWKELGSAWIGSMSD